MIKTTVINKVVKIEEQDEEDEPADGQYKDIIRE